MSPNTTPRAPSSRVPRAVLRLIALPARVIPGRANLNARSERPGRPPGGRGWTTSVVRARLAPAPRELAAAGEGRADGAGDVLERGDRPVGEAQPDGRDP